MIRVIRVIRGKKKPAILWRAVINYKKQYIYFITAVLSQHGLSSQHADDGQQFSVFLLFLFDLPLSAANATVVDNIEIAIRLNNSFFMLYGY